MSGATKRQGESPSVMDWFRLPAWMANHWHTSAENPWGFVMEQRDAYGHYRHRSFDDKLDPTPWLSGPHPIAQKLRDEGKEETAGFNWKNRP